MNVIITQEDNTTYEYEFDQESVVIGRGNKCDIVISNDHISRKHLEIREVEGVVYIKDLTLSNWVSYNEEKLVKNTDIQYFDFAPLILPGGINVKVEQDKPEDFNVSDIIREGTRTRSKNKVDIYNTRLTRVTDIDAEKAARKERKEAKKAEQKAKKSEDTKKMVIFFFIVALAFAYYYLYELPQTEYAPPPPANTPQKKVKKPIKKKIIKRKVKKEQPQAVPAQPGTTQTSQAKEFQAGQKPANFQKFDQLINDTGKCEVGVIQNLCTAIFTSVIPPEGAVIKQFELHVFKNFRMRLEKIYSNNYDQINEAMKKEGMQKFVAADGLLVKKILEGIELQKISKVKVYIFSQHSAGNSLMSSYEFDPSIYRRFSDKEFQYARQEVQEKIDLNYFNGKFGRFLVKE